MFRCLCLLPLCLFVFGCKTKEAPKESITLEVKLKIDGEEYTSAQLKRNHKALDAYTAWQAKWFPGEEYWESRRPFAGMPDQVGHAIADLDAIINDWRGTPASERAATMKRLIEGILTSGTSGREWEEKMAWLCKQECDLLD